MTKSLKGFMPVSGSVCDVSFPCYHSFPQNTLNCCRLVLSKSLAVEVAFIDTVMAACSGRCCDSIVILSPVVFPGRVSSSEDN